MKQNLYKKILKNTTCIKTVLFNYNNDAQKRHQKIVSKTDACLCLNPLTKNTYNKYENVVSNYYMMRNTSKIALKNDAKNHSQQQLTWKKLSHGHVCPGH